MSPGSATDSSILPNLPAVAFLRKMAGSDTPEQWPGSSVGRAGD